MKHVIILRSALGTQGGHLKCDGIRYKGQVYIITQDLRVVLKNAALPSDVPLYMKVTPQNAYTFNYNDRDETDGGNTARMKMAEILMYHHQVNTIEGVEYVTDTGRKVPYNPNATAGLLFDYEDMAYSAMKNIGVLNMDIDAQNKGRNMSFKGKADAYYYYGGNPQGMNHGELFMRLCEPMSIVRQRIPFGSTGKTYLAHFVEDYKSEDPLYVLKTTIIKAMNLTHNNRPIISKESNTLMFDGKILGSTLDDASLWFMGNPERKDYLIRIVSEMDTLGVDDIDDVLNEVEKGTDGAEIIKEQMNEREIRARAKALWIPNHWNGELKKLTEQIPDAEKTWQHVESLGLQGQVDVMKGKSLKEVKELVERKLKDAEIVA